MKFGDQVIYTENGVDFSATVLSERILDSHAGTNGEPMLNLGFFKQVSKVNFVYNDVGHATPEHTEVVEVVGGTRQGELVQFRSDVAHVSVDQVAGAVYPGGRWKDPSTSIPALVSTDAGVIEVPTHEHANLGHDEDPIMGEFASSNSANSAPVPITDSEPGAQIPDPIHPMGQIAETPVQTVTEPVKAEEPETLPALKEPEPTVQ